MFFIRRRRFRGDMIEMFKMMYGTDKINLGRRFCIDEDRGTREQSLGLKIRRHVISNIGLNFFTRRIINY